MKTKEIIETLRACANPDIDCQSCPRYVRPEIWKTFPCFTGLMQESADALEAALRGQEEQENPKPLTNGDKIRAMSDDELVSILMGVPDYPCDVKIPAGDCNEKCEKCIMDWLQQPAEGE